MRIDELPKISTSGISEELKNSVESMPADLFAKLRDVLSSELMQERIKTGNELITKITKLYEQYAHPIKEVKVFLSLIEPPFLEYYGLLRDIGKIADRRGIELDEIEELDHDNFDLPRELLNGILKTTPATVLEYLVKGSLPEDEESDEDSEDLDDEEDGIDEEDEIEFRLSNIEDSIERLETLLESVSDKINSI